MDSIELPEQEQAPETEPQTSLERDILDQRLVDEALDQKKFGPIIERYEARRELEQSPLPRTPFELRKSDVERLNYNILSHIFHGIHNLRIPVAMLAVMNTDERLAKYFGAGILKGSVRHQLICQQPKDFIGAARILDDLAYGTARRFGVYWKKEFSAKSGEQKARLNSLDDGVKDEFVESVYAPNNRNYYDPNIDGRDRSLYAGKIYEFMQRRERELDLLKFDRT